MEQKDKTISKPNKKVIVAIGIGAIGLATVIGYTVGVKLTKNRITNGIQQLWVTDPELEERMWNALAKGIVRKNGITRPGA